MITSFISMIKNIFKKLDKTALCVLKHGLHFCFYLCLISTIVLFVYLSFKLNPFVFDLGFMLFKLSIIFAIEFIICAIAADKIKKQLV